MIGFRFLGQGFRIVQGLGFGFEGLIFGVWCVVYLLSIHGFRVGKRSRLVFGV